MVDGSAAEQRWWWRAGIWAVLAAGLYAAGVSGYLHLIQLDPGHPQTLSVPEALYRGLRLFTLNVDLPDGTQAPWWLWVAAFLAPVLLAGGVVALLWTRVSRVLLWLFGRPRLVVFGANPNTTALVRAATADVRTGSWARRMWRGGWWRRDVVVVVDARPRALADAAGDLVHTVVGEGVGAAVLRQAAVAKAAEVVVATGDSVRNAAITSAVLSHVPPPPRVDVEITDPSLAEAVEQDHLRSGVTVTAFDPMAVTAVGVLDVVDRHAAPGTGDPPGILVFGTGPLLDAFVLDLFRRRRAWEVAGGAEIPRIVVFGPDAPERCTDLTRRVVGEGLARDLEAIKVDLDPSSELGPDTTRHVDRYATQLVVVAVPRYHQGGHVALTLRRRLARQVPVVLVTEPSDSPFGNVDDWRAPATGTGVRVFSVAQCGYDPRELASNRLVERLARGLYEADPPQPERAWAKADDAARQSKRDDARTLYDELVRNDVPLRRSAAVDLPSIEQALVHALGVREPDTLPLAGLRVDFTAPEALVTAAENLHDPDHAFQAWCEVARLRAVAAELEADHPAGATEDVDRLLRLRRAALGDAGAKASLPSVGTLRVDRRVVVLIGDPPGGCRARVAALLEPALRQVAYPPTVFHAGDPAVALALGVTSVPSTADTARRRALDLWTAMVQQGGKPSDVRVLVLPGAAADEILLARALDARIGRPWWSGEPDTEADAALLGGPVGLVPLPADRMIIRAFLRPAAAQPKREQLAAELHRRYVSHQRDRKPGDDPALRPFSRLLPWLRESNLAMADDILDKLAEVGLRVVDDPTVAADQRWPASVTDADRERLAEMEHGRFAAERIQNGWAAAPRDLDRLMSPHLVPWCELTEEIKNYDREAIADLPRVLAAVELRLCPA